MFALDIALTHIDDRQSTMEMFRDFLRINHKSKMKVDYTMFYKMKLRREDLLWNFNVLN